MAEKVLIYRPYGEHPPGTKMGDLLLGRLHEVTAEQADVYALKGFVTMPADAKPATSDALASMYALAKDASDAVAEKIGEASIASALPSSYEPPFTGENPDEWLPDDSPEPMNRRSKDKG